MRSSKPESTPTRASRDIVTRPRREGHQRSLALPSPAGYCLMTAALGRVVVTSELNISLDTLIIRRPVQRTCRAEGPIDGRFSSVR